MKLDQHYRTIVASLIRDLSDEELSLYRDEIARRDRERHGERIAEREQINGLRQREAVANTSGDPRMDHEVGFDKE